MSNEQITDYITTVLDHNPITVPQQRQTHVRNSFKKHGLQIVSFQGDITYHHDDGEIMTLSDADDFLVALIPRLRQKQFWYEFPQESSGWSIRALLPCDTQIFLPAQLWAPYL